MFAGMNKMLFLFFALTWSIYSPCFGQVEGTRISEDEAKAQNDYLEADAAFFLGEFEEAIKKYKEIYALDRSNDAVAYNLSRAYLGSGDIESAEKYMLRAMELAPDNKWYKLLHANVMRDEERHAEALTSYEWLAQKEPENRYFIENHAYSLLKLERPLEAIGVIESWESTQGISEVFSKKKFEIYDAMGQTDKAAEALTTLAETYPRTLRFWHNLASYYIKSGKEDKAGETYEKILSLDASNADAKAKLASLRGGSTADAQLTQIIDDASIGEDDKVLILLPLLDEVITKKDSTQKALLLDLCGKLSKQYPSSAKVFALLGDAHFHGTNYPNAITAYETTLQSNKKVYPVWENYMHALFRTSNFDELITVAYDAIDNFPNKVSAYYYYVLALSNTGEFMEADSYVMEASMIAGSNPNMKRLVQTSSAYRYFKDQNIDKADEILSQIPIELLPYQALDLKGDIALAKGDKKKAIEYWEKAYSMVPESSIKNKVLEQSL